MSCSVVTRSGMPVYETDDRAEALAYIRQAEHKGAEPGSLRIMISHIDLPADLYYTLSEE